MDPTVGWRTTHFWGPVTNWGLVAVAARDMCGNKSETDVGMAMTLALVSLCFMRFAWRVHPRNLLLLACHGVHAAMQAVLARRAAQAQARHLRLGRRMTFATLGVCGACGLAQYLRPMAPASLTGATGPYTIFFWAPMSRWGIFYRNLVAPSDRISTMQTALQAISGLVWARYAFVISPVNYNLAFVQAACALSSLFRLAPTRTVVARFFRLRH